jgi:hypothetical protein
MQRCTWLSTTAVYRSKPLAQVKWVWGPRNPHDLAKAEKAWSNKINNATDRSFTSSIPS